MSFHHHKNHHHHHQQNQHLSSSCCCCCNTCSCCNCSCSSNSNSNSNLPNSQSQISNQLLQTLTTHLLLQSQQPQILLKPDSHFNLHHHHHKDDQQQQQSLIQSLLRRVTALESSLSNLSTSRLGRQEDVSSQKHSIKHLAAVTIQRHFRQLLARRSQTLRDLKRLASIKSQSASLRSLVSDKSLKNPRAISKEAMDLLFQLDSIKNSDAMIREGKRAISKELVRILEFVDKVLIREDEDEVDGLIRRRERGRRVSFAENGHEGKVFDDLLERSSDEEEDTRLKNRGFYNRLSDGEESPKDRRNRVNGGSGLAAPLPVQMEPRRNGLTKKVAIDEC